jgi:lantibiotic modifying enzyme
MKHKKFKQLIQKPLRFHHQDIHEELEEIKGMLSDVISQMQVLQQRINECSKTSDVQLSQSDNYYRGQDYSSRYDPSSTVEL